MSGRGVAETFLMVYIKRSKNMNHHFNEHFSYMTVYISFIKLLKIIKSYICKCMALKNKIVISLIQAESFGTGAFLFKSLLFNEIQYIYTKSPYGRYSDIAVKRKCRWDRSKLCTSNCKQ